MTSFTVKPLLRGNFDGNLKMSVLIKQTILYLVVIYISWHYILSSSNMVESTYCMEWVILYVIWKALSMEDAFLFIN